MTDEDKALVGRLRKDTNETDTWNRKKNWTEQRSERREAAARIEAQAAEIEKLQYLNDLNAVPAGIIEDRGRMEERSKIVAWLRETQEVFQRLIDLRKYPLVSKHHMEHCKHSADAIEAMEHLK